MKTRKLRLVSALLALAMLLAMVPVGAWAEDSSGSSAGTYIQIDDLAIDNDGFPYNPQYDKDSPNYRKGAHWSYSKDEYSSDLVFDISNEATIVLDLSSKTLNGKISANRLKLAAGWLSTMYPSMIRFQLIHLALMAESMILALLCILVITLQIKLL